MSHLISLTLISADGLLGTQLPTDYPPESPNTACFHSFYCYAVSTFWFKWLDHPNGPSMLTLGSDFSINSWWMVLSNIAKHAWRSLGRERWAYCTRGKGFKWSNGKETHLVWSQQLPRLWTAASYPYPSSPPLISHHLWAMPLHPRISFQVSNQMASFWDIFSLCLPWLRIIFLATSLQF